VIGRCGDIDGVWIAPVTAQVMITLRGLAMVLFLARRWVALQFGDKLGSKGEALFSDQSSETSDQKADATTTSCASWSLVSDDWSLKAPSLLVLSHGRDILRRQ